MTLPIIPLGLITGDVSFPKVENTSTYSASAGLIYPVTLPSGIVPGDLLIMYSVLVGSLTTWTGPSGWTLGWDVALGGGGTLHRFASWYKIADGSEGSTATVTTALATNATTHQVYRISGFQGVPSSVVTFNAVGSASADPPPNSPSWGLDRTLWLAVMGANNDSVPGTPAGYSNLVRIAPGSAVQLCSMRREAAVASEDPAPYIITNTPWCSATTAIRAAA